MTLTQIAVVALCSSTISAVIVCVTIYVNKQANRAESPPPDHGGIPVGLRNEWGKAYKEYPLGSHGVCVPGEPVVPKRRRPRTGGVGFHRVIIDLLNGERYVIVFPKNVNPTDVLVAAHEWSENPELSFNGFCEDGVLDLMIERESKME